jgi:Tol biopolymer transport system component
VAFTSRATNLVANDDATAIDAFFRDTVKGKTVRISVNSAGEQGNGNSFHVAMSRDGKYIVFDSFSDNLDPSDSNGPDVFLYDRPNKTLTGVSHAMQTTFGSHGGQSPSISYDGSRIVFNTFKDKDGGTQGTVWLTDRTGSFFTQVSVTTGGDTPDGNSGPATISGNGAQVAYVSSATDIVPDDTNEKNDVFLATVGSSGAVVSSVIRVSVKSNGDQGNDGSSAYSDDVDTSKSGNSVAFDSFATNFVNDTNNAADVFVHVK